MEFSLLTLFGIFLACVLMDTLAPGILGATAYLMLLNSEKKMQRLLLFLLLTQGAYFVLGITFMLGIEPVIAGFHYLRESFFTGVVFVLVGLTLIYLSFALPKLVKNKSTNLYARIFQKLGNSLSVKAVVLLAVIIFFLEVTQAFPYWIVLGLMAFNELSLPIWLPTLAVYNILMVLPSLILLLLYKFNPEKTESKLEKLRDRLMKSNAFLWVLGGAGGIFLHIGLRVLLE